jgi:predicted ATP-dependent endonuclease of OLD family
MIQYLKLFNHKGINDIILSNLGQINVICGKNNSGKSSILEAMTMKDHYSLGKSIDQSLKELFTPHSNKYSNPTPLQTQRWFNVLVDILQHKKEIWFDSDIKLNSEQIKNAMKQEPSLANYDRNIFTFDSILQQFFKSTNENYKPYLIPPKRSINFEVPISTNSEIVATGEGIINRLFFLKNQDIKSKDYETYKSIYTEFEFITGNNFNIIPKKDNKIELKFNNKNNDWIPAVNCGLGLSDVLIILGLIFLIDKNIFLIEEPENHLHAEFQKRLLNLFKRQMNKQFFLATHSNVFLDPNVVDRIIYTEFKDTIKVSDVTSRSTIISSLGYSVSDNLSSDIIILTEGTTDIPIIKEILSWKGLGLNHNIKFWPLGGDMMSNLDLSVLAQDHELVALIDNDFASKDSRDEFITKCGSLNIDCTQLNRYAIENYLSLKAIKEVFGNQVPSNLEKLENSNSIKSQLGFNIKSKNYQIIKKMSLQDFQETDLLDFCDKIESKLKQNLT